VIDTGGMQQQYRYDAAGRLAQVLDGNGNVWGPTGAVRAARD
jgi:YD repeat-containing protein